MPTQRNELNFKDEKIYVGIDVHLKKWSVSIFTQHIHHKTFSQEPCAEKLVDYLKRNFPGGTYFCAYEAGFSGLWLHRELISLGVNNIVVNPADIPTSHKETDRKRDAVDSAKIARSLRSGELTGIYIHCNESLHLRSLLRLRCSMVVDLNRIKNRIKGMLYYYGIDYPIEFKEDKKHWSTVFLKWLHTVEESPRMASCAFGFLLQAYSSSRTKLLTITREIRVLSRSLRWKDDMEIITSIPGIGLITAMTFLVNIEQIGRFKSPDHFAGFLGIVPSCYGSGDKERTGQITARRPRELRRLLIESCWIAVRRDPAMNLCFTKLCHRMDSNKAIIRIARKLSNRIYTLLKNKQKYVYCVVESKR